MSVINSNFSSNRWKGIIKIKNIRNPNEVIRISVEIKENIKIKILILNIIKISKIRMFNSSIH